MSETAAAATPLVDVTESVHKWLSAKIGAVELKNQKVVVPVDVGFIMFISAVTNAFPETRLLIKDDDWKLLFEAVMGSYQRQDKDDEPKVVEMDTKTRGLREREFSQPYIGADIPAQLQSYIGKCWNHYCVQRSSPSISNLAYPYTTIVQSSGFGKSRLLRELAERTKATDAPHMKVLYVCVRQGDSTGYPEKTHSWPDYLFSSVGIGGLDDQLVNDLSSRLQTVFRNAMRTWDSVGEDCFEHFTNPAQGTPTHTALTSKEPFDQTGWFRRLRRALNHANAAIKTIYGTYAGIFAILIDTNSKISNFTPPPLRDGSSREVTTRNSVLFPPFILTHTMDIILDANMSKKYQENEVSSSSGFYRELMKTDLEGMRDYLVDMGRPLWQRYKVAKEALGQEEVSSDDRWEALLTFAASKLADVVQDTSTVAECDSGITALLCRVGIRPYSWSPLASRLVADYMAVLSHMGCTHDQFVSSYASEPILTFGAARLWYGLAVKPIQSSALPTPNLLEHRILPELRKILHQEVLDTGGVGELVARIVLLLTMDATGVVKMKKESARCYDGDFYSVATFLQTLSGDSTEVVESDGRQVTDLLVPWQSWKVGFSHFVQLSEEPSKDVLWAMLARRAACALPRNFKGIDLMIPIFKDSQVPEVSMILIQVKNREDGDSDYPDSAVLDTRPGHEFKGDLKNFASKDVVRVYMSLRGFNSLEQYFAVDPGVRRSQRLKGYRPSASGTSSRPPSPPTTASCGDAPKLGASLHEATPPDSTEVASSFVLCFRGLSGWHARNGDGKSVEVVSERMVDHLKPLLTPWRKLTKMVEADLDLRGERFGMERSKVMQIALRPLVQTVFVNKWKDVTQAISVNAAGRADSTRVRSRPDAMDESEQSTKRQKLMTKKKGKMKLVSSNSNEEDQDDAREGDDGNNF